MNIKLTVYLTAILAAAIVVVVFVINPKNKNNAARHAEVRRVFHITDPGDISGIELQNKNGEFILDKKAGGTWVLTSPVETDADASVVHTLIRAFETMDYKKKIGPAGSLAAFGLSPAGITATVQSSDNTAYSLTIGAAAPLGHDYYALADNGIPGIFTVTGMLRKKFDGTLFQLRRKRLVDFSQDEIASISFTRDSKPVYTLKKGKSVWTFVKPSYNRLKTSVLHDMEFQLTNLTATGIIDGVKDLRSMGLEKPSGVISIVLMDNRKYSIKLGKYTGDKSVYAMVAGRPVVYVIDRSAIAPFVKSIREMADTRLLAEDRLAITSILATGGGKTVLLTRGLHDQWNRNGTAFTGVSSVNNLLDALVSLKAERFVPNTALLKHPAYTFTVTGTLQPTTTTISIGNREKGTIYAGTSLDPRLSVLNTLEAGTLEKDLKEIYQ